MNIRNAFNTTVYLMQDTKDLLSETFHHPFKMAWYLFKNAIRLAFATLRLSLRMIFGEGTMRDRIMNENQTRSLAGNIFNTSKEAIIKAYCMYKHKEYADFRAQDIDGEQEINREDYQETKQEGQEYSISKEQEIAEKYHINCDYAPEGLTFAGGTSIRCTYVVDNTIYSFPITDEQEKAIQEGPGTYQAGIITLVKENMLQNHIVCDLNRDYIKEKAEQLHKEQAQQQSETKAETQAETRSQSQSSTRDRDYREKVKDIVDNINEDVKKGKPNFKEDYGENLKNVSLSKAAGYNYKISYTAFDKSYSFTTSLEESARIRKMIRRGEPMADVSHELAARHFEKWCKNPLHSLTMRR